MLSLAIATTLCIGTLGINEVQAATLHFGNYGTYLVYIATTTNTNTTAGRHGANNRTQLDPAALSEFEIQDTSKSNKVYSSNIIWLKKTANDLLMTYSRETSVGKFDSSLSSTKNWTFSKLVGSGSIKKETIQEQGSVAKFYCDHVKLSSLTNGTIFEVSIPSVGSHQGCTAYILVGDMNSCIPQFYKGSSKLSNSNNSYYLTIKKNETANLVIKYPNYDFDHTYQATQSNSSVTSISGLNGKPLQNQMIVQENS